MNTHTTPYTLLGVPLHLLTISNILDTIKKGLNAPPKFFHLVSINPETVIIAQSDSELMRIYHSADLALCDGSGVKIAATIHGIPIPERVPGSVLLPRLLDLAGQMSSTVVLIGSQSKLAEKIANCYSRSYPKAKFIGTIGYQNISKPTPSEEKEIESIVRSTRPRFVFVAFGTPYQEKWIDSHKELLDGAICMGVGGAFDYLAGAAKQPPQFISQLGLEWLFRLFFQPWRIKRQITRLPLFIFLVIREKMKSIMLRKNEQQS